MKTAKIVLLALISSALIECKARDIPPELQQQTTTASGTAGQPQKFVWPPLWNEPKDGSLTVAANLLAKNYLVVLDASGSMQDHACEADWGTTKMQVAKQALTAFAGAVPADANLGFTVFENSEIKPRLPLGLNNHQEFIAAVQTVTAVGGTPLYEAVVEGYKSLTRQAQSQLGYGEYFLVMVTDGEANSGQEPDRMVDFIVENTPITLYTIGFCIGSHHTLNRPGVTYYREANNPQQLISALRQVLAEAPEFQSIDSFQP